MEKLIQKSSWVFRILITFTLLACDKLPVEFGLRVEDRQGNSVNCNDLDAGFGIEVPYMIETDQKVNLKFNGEASAIWTIQTRDGAIELNGENVEVKFPEAGIVEGTMKAVNICNNEEEHQFRLNVITALGAPQISINNGETYTNSNSLSLKHQVKGAESMILSASADCSGDWETYESQSLVDVLSKNSSNKIFAKFSNRLRETNCVSASIVHDSIAPELVLSNIPSSLSNLKNIAIGTAATDSGSGVDKVICSLNGESYSDCKAGFLKSNLKEGSHNLMARAVDKIGNVSSVVNVQFKLDHTAPVVSFVNTPDVYTSIGKQTYAMKLSGQVGEKLAIKCRYNGVEVKACKESQSLDIKSEGTHRFDVQVLDEAGNASEVIEHSFIADVTGPITTIVSKPLDPSVDKSANFHFTAIDSGVGGVKSFCSIDAKNFAACSSPVSYSKLSNAIHVFDVYSVDALGNKGATQRYSWEIDEGIVSDEILVGKPVKKVDILVVVDNSSSMKKEQKEMGKRFGNFVSSLSGLDWQLGIITTNASDDGPHSAGRLQNFDDGSGVPRRSISSTDSDAEKMFHKTIQRKEKGNDTEEAIRSVRKFLDREDASILRNEAHFATIIISDEDEKSRGRSLKDANKPKKLVEAIQSKYRGRKVFTNHSIVWRPGDQNCSRKGGKYEANVYAELTDMTDGILGDICSKNYTNQLLDIGDRIQETAFSIALKCAPRDMDGDGVGDVRVTINPKPNSPITHKIRNNKLFFSPYPEEGSKVHLVYRCPTK